MTEYVLGFYLWGSRFVLLIRKNRPDWQAGKLNGIGGHIEPGETPEQAMVREFREEAGPETSGWIQFAELNFPGSAAVSRARVHCFFRRVEPGTVESIWSPTDEKVEFFRVDMLPDDALPNIPWLIAMARSHKPGQQFFFEITEIPC